MALRVMKSSTRASINQRGYILVREIMQLGYIGQAARMLYLVSLMRQRKGNEAPRDGGARILALNMLSKEIGCNMNNWSDKGKWGRRWGRVNKGD